MTDKIDEILTRGVAEVVDRKDLEQKLRSKKKLRVKLGIDPTSKSIHIGRAISLWKMRALQDLGHKIVFIIGDFTGLIGDTSDKESERPMLTVKDVKENMKGYIAQVGKIIDLKKAEVHFNSKWLKKLGFLEIAEQANEFSLHEFTARENIAKRMKAEKRVSLREVLYPLMQGYDSVAIKSDLELGGTDQRFNLLAGRSLQRRYGQDPQNIMTFDLLEGTDGRKMSSSWGNVINVADAPNDMFGKTMTILDGLILKYYTSCTQVSNDDLLRIEKELKSEKTNPRDLKAKLAWEIVSLYHGKKEADAAMAEFDRVHKKKELPDQIPSFKLAGEQIVKVLTASNLAKSASEAKRLIDQGGVRIDGVVCKDYAKPVSKDSVIQVGKRNFVKIK